MHPCSLHSDTAFTASIHSVEVNEGSDLNSIPNPTRLLCLHPKRVLLGICDKYQSLTRLLFSYSFFILALRLYNFFSYSIQLSMKLILLINAKMPTTVGILTFISKINTTYESFKAIIWGI